LRYNIMMCQSITSLRKNLPLRNLAPLPTATQVRQLGEQHGEALAAVQQAERQLAERRCQLADSDGACAGAQRRLDALQCEMHAAAAALQSRREELAELATREEAQAQGFEARVQVGA
jgi:hypothetical protein